MTMDAGSSLDEAIDVYKRVYAIAADREHVDLAEIRRQRDGLQAMIEAHWTKLNRSRLDVLSGRLAAKDYETAKLRIIGLLQGVVLDDARTIIREIEVSDAMLTGEHGN